MRANEFIKNFGWEKARLVVKGLLPMHEGYPVFDYNSDDLKRYVDAYELVSLFGDDISHAKKYLKEMLFKFREGMEFYVEDDCRSFSLLELQQTITLVEECQ